MDADTVAVRGGLATLGPEAVALRGALEAVFLSWADDCTAAPTLYPPLLALEDLARIDWFANFPHLGVLTTGLTAPAIEELHDCGTDEVASESLQPARYALPSAACYSVYLDLQGRTLDAPLRVTTVANCFRREDHFDGLRRLLGFSMREIVCVGDREAVLDHLARFRARILRFVEAVGLPIELQPASDPFFDQSASRSLMAQLFPVKEELVYDGTLAIGSLNFHRNFFGERCSIALADGGAAFSGCVAFGLERWISALTAHFGDDAGALAGRLAEASAASAE